MKKEDLKILLIEDDHNTRSTIRHMLIEIGITQIFESTDGKEAQDFIDKEENKIDLIISDWNMPHKTGFEFLREIKQTHPDIPFIMITARADINSVKNAMEAGVTSYIRKPFSLDDMESKISLALKSISESGPT